MRRVIKKNKGKICVLVSAFLYGLTPIFAKVTYSGGANGITLTFLRAVMTVPVLLILMRISNTAMAVTKAEALKILILSLFGGTAPILLLYLSYDYISAGLATTLHFIYPLVIVFASAFIYHERISALTLVAAILVTAGIFMFVRIRTEADTFGVVLALLSGIFYSFYVIYLDKSGLDKMDYIKLTFYLMLNMSAMTLVFGLAANEIRFELTKKAWFYAGFISIIVTVIATPMFQAGVKYEGAAEAGILSAFEPVTASLLGAVFLGEALGIYQIAGGIVIIAGLYIAQKFA